MTEASVSADFNTVREDFKEVLDRIEGEKKTYLGQLYNPSHIEAVIINQDTQVQYYREIYDRGALLVISTTDRDASGYIATMKRFMQDAKYSAYHLETHSYYTVSVWPGV